MRQAQEHLDKVLTAIPPKELEEEEKYLEKLGRNYGKLQIYFILILLWKKKIH